jgi:FMN phosphatase YigB (HAD superfamily)
MADRRFQSTLHTVTFDCWSTLIFEPPGQGGGAARAARLASTLGVEPATAAAALAEAWQLHQRAWHQRSAFTGPDMLRHALCRLGAQLEASAHARLLASLEEDVLEREVRAIDGARELLAQLRQRKVRTALICDTGFTPGRVIRQLLARMGLLESLEVAIFSDEIGVPKPHPLAFERALSALGTSARGAAHVGDLRRSDVAGARMAGMLAVRLRAHHDDGEAGPGANAGVFDCAAAGCNPACERPEGDLVMDSYAALWAFLDPRTGSVH